MKRIRIVVPAIAATMLLAACGSVDEAGLESIAAGSAGELALQDERSLPEWHPQLPPGHPPLMQGPTRLPPGHPAVPAGQDTCPAGGILSEPDSQRFRDFEANPHDAIAI